MEQLRELEGCGMRLAVDQKYLVECFGPDGKLKWAEEFHNRVVTAGLDKYLDATLKTGLAAPLWYVGLVGNFISDGAITSGQAILTSASNPFTSADVGAGIIVRGAGAAGADLVTTILSYQSAGQVTLNTNAGTTVTNAKVGKDARPLDTMASHASWTEITPYSDGTRPQFNPGTISSGSVNNSASKAVFNINATASVFGAFMADNSTKGGATGTLMGMGVFSGSSRDVASGDTLNVTVTATLTAS